MSTHSDDRKTVLYGILAAWCLSALFLGVGHFFSVQHGWFGDRTPEEIVAISIIPAAFSLIIGIGWAARTRHFKQNIDGSPPPLGSPLELTLRYVQNTAEQLLLFVLAIFCLSFAAPDLADKIAPLLGLWFLIARLLFWAGYRKAPLLRAVGFAATFHPTIAVFLFAGLRLLH